MCWKLNFLCNDGTDEWPGGPAESVCCVMLESVSVQSLADHWQLVISYTVTCHQGQPHAADISHSHLMVTGDISHQDLAVMAQVTVHTQNRRLQFQRVVKWKQVLSIIH